MTSILTPSNRQEYATPRENWMSSQLQDHQMESNKENEYKYSMTVYYNMLRRRESKQTIPDRSVATAFLGDRKTDILKMR